MPLSRQEIIGALDRALRPLPFVRSMFEAGSAAFGRLDAWSDLDLTFDVDDGREDETFAAIEAALAVLSSIRHRLALPTPASHGLAQRFYRLEKTDEWLMLDISLRPTSKPGHYSEVELHGTPSVIFDKGEFTRPKPLDHEKTRGEMAKRLETLRHSYPLLANLARKEGLRGRALDAAGFYQSHLLRPLVEMLRMRYAPDRWNFGLRYVHSDLPPEVVARLARLAYPRDCADLVEKAREAEAWGSQELARLLNS